MNIIITGASKGLGYAIAEVFTKDGSDHTFFLCARSQTDLEQAATQLRGFSTQIAIHIFPCDVSNKNELLAFAQHILAQTNDIDILVNNAGSFLPGSIGNEPERTLETMIETNLYSAYHLTRLLLPGMVKAGKGHIFNICSIASLAAYRNGASYSISKFALMGFSKNLRDEMKEHNIKVTAVYPGAFMSDSWRGSGINPERIMEANDIANMIYAAAHLSPQACVEDIILRPQPGDL
jgi:short-subunit dehydrogenase